jgi:hypothetical protein
MVSMNDGRKILSSQRVIVIGAMAITIVLGGGAAVSRTIQDVDGWIGGHSWVLMALLVPLAYHWSRRRLQLADAASQARFGALGLTLAEPAAARRGPLVLSGEVGGHPAEVHVTHDGTDLLQRTVVSTGVPSAFVATGGKAGWRAVAGIVPHALLVHAAGDGSVTVRAGTSAITLERRLPGHKGDGTSHVRADLALAEHVLAAVRPGAVLPAAAAAGQAV